MHVLSHIRVVPSDHFFVIPRNHVQQRQRGTLHTVRVRNLRGGAFSVLLVRDCGPIPLAPPVTLTYSSSTGRIRGITSFHTELTLLGGDTLVNRGDL